MTRDTEPVDPQGWGTAVDPSNGETPAPGDIIISDAGSVATPEPLVGTGDSSPLEDDEPEGTIPPCPLWAMKVRRHIQWHLLPSHERHDRIRDCVRSGDEVLYLIDDGRHHAVVGRRVGAVRDECQYCLVGRIPLETYERLTSGSLPATSAFDDAEDITLCGVAIERDVRSSNVFDVARFESIDDVPAAYRPGAPYLDLEEDLEISA